MPSNRAAVPQSDSSTVCQWFARCTNPAALCGDRGVPLSCSETSWAPCIPDQSISLRALLRARRAARNCRTVDIAWDACRPLTRPTRHWSAPPTATGMLSVPGCAVCATKRVSPRRPSPGILGRQSAIARIESGQQRLSLHSVKRIATVLGCDAALVIVHRAAS